VRRFSRRPDHRPLVLRQDCLAELQRLLQTAAERPANRCRLEIALSLSLHPTCVDAVRRSLGSELQSLVVEGGGRLADAVRCLLESPESDSKEQPRWTTDAFSGPNEGQKPSVLPLENGAASAYLVLSWSRQDSDAAFARWLVAKLNENWHRTIDLSTDSTAGLIDGCRAVILCVSKPYELNSLCEFEAHRAEVLEKPLVPLLCGEGYQPGSWLSPILARYSAQADLLIDFSKQRDRAKSFSTLIGRLN
uniref:TIR domain-containing protein n=1 Tax=Macrostomum lignano TaxID=282301 RepID=A0A1I8IT36_9PLAT